MIPEFVQVSEPATPSSYVEVAYPSDDSPILVPHNSPLSDIDEDQLMV